MKVNDIVANNDWQLLQQQKHWLIARAAEGSEEAEGLVNLLDSIQDAAVDEFGLAEDVVFCKNPAHMGSAEPESTDPPVQERHGLSRDERVNRIVDVQLAGDLNDPDMQTWLRGVLRNGFGGYSTLADSDLDAEYDGVVGDGLYGDLEDDGASPDGEAAE